MLPVQVVAAAVVVALQVLVAMLLHKQAESTDQVLG
jgi:hypothetical protein